MDRRYSTPNHNLSDRSDWLQSWLQFVLCTIVSVFSRPRNHLKRSSCPLFYFIVEFSFEPIIEHSRSALCFSTQIFISIRSMFAEPTMAGDFERTVNCMQLEYIYISVDFLLHFKTPAAVLFGFVFSHTQTASSMERN